MIAKRYSSADPSIQGQLVVLASDCDRIDQELSSTRSELEARTYASLQLQAKLVGLEQELSAVRGISTVFDSDASLEDLMEAAGMFTVPQVMAGLPIDVFVRHAGVTNLESFGQWLEMKRAQFMKMQARSELADRDSDELYEWVMSHAAVFSAVMINFRLATQSTGPTDPPGLTAGNPKPKLH